MSFKLVSFLHLYYQKHEAFSRLKRIRQYVKWDADQS